MTPSVSFVMPAYKSAFLRQALESIMNQTSPDWELIVVDDCSPEDLKGIVTECCGSDPRVSYHRNTRNIGGTSLVRQWNHSIRFAQGEWLVLAADDDVYSPLFCESVLSLAGKYPEVDLIRSRVETIDESGTHLGDDGMPPEFQDRTEYLWSWLKADIYTCIGNYAFRRIPLCRIGFYDYPCGYCSDVATPVALSCNGVANTSEMLFSFRLSSMNLSGDSSRIEEKITAATMLYRMLGSLKHEPSVDGDYLHAKCIYDYFNQGVKFSPLKSLPHYLKMCELAGPSEKAMMLLRWMKRRIVK